MSQGLRAIYTHERISERSGRAENTAGWILTGYSTCEPTTVANGKRTFQRVNDEFSCGYVFGRTGPLVAEDGPFNWDKRHREHDHARHGEDRDNEGDAEATEDLGDFQEEVTPLDFLFCRTPFCQKSWTRGELRSYGKDSRML